MQKRKRLNYFLIFIGLFVLLMITIQMSTGFVVYPGRKWPDSQATAVPYSVNENDVPASINLPSVAQVASNKWNAVSTSYFAFNYTGIDNSHYYDGTNDGYNTWSWNKDGSGMGSSTLAVNHFWMNSVTNAMIEFDIEFNGTKSFVWDPNPSSGTYDIQHVATHEAGHSLHLDHPADSSAVMYAYYNGQRELQQDDLNGITYLYPFNVTPTASPENTQTSSPTVVPTATPTSGGGGSGGGGCFIATAAYGSYLDGDVVVLRNFRDEVMMKSKPGRKMVNAYYTYSPPVASYISERPALRTFTRWALTPIVYSVKHPVFSALALILFAGLFITAVRKKLYVKK